LRRAGLVTLTSWGSRLLTSALGLVNVRLLLLWLGEDKYAPLLLLANLLSWFALADLGLGNALQNRISEGRARAEPTGADVRAVAKDLMWVALTVALILPGLASVLGPRYLQHTEASRAVTMFLAAGVLLLVTSLASVAQKVWYAEQRGYLAHASAVVASLLTTVSLSIAMHLPESDDASFFGLACLLGPACLVNLVSFVIVVARSGRQGPAKPLRARAAHFLGIAALATAILSLDFLLMSQKIEAASIVLYSVVSRVFEVVNLFYSAVLLALWPGYAEDIARGDLAKMRAHLRRYLLLAMPATAFVCFCLALAMPPLLRLLSPRTPLVVSWPFLGALILLTLVKTWTHTFGMVLQSGNVLRPMLASMSVQVILNAGLQWSLIDAMSITGISLGLACSYLLTGVWAYPWLVARLETAAKRT
jgi:O-antigen/teichoic acid export membrane protein